MLTWRGYSIGLSVCLYSVGCAQSSPHLLHHPNRAGRFDGYVGYSLPIQPARARIIVAPTESTNPTPIAHELSSNTGVLVPELFPSYIAYVYDPKLYGSVGLTDHLTLVGEAGWHRIGLAANYFTRTEGRRGLKLAGGVASGTFVQEFYGWAEMGWLPVLSEEWAGYVGASTSVGQFRHFFRVPEDLDGVPDFDDSIPTVLSFMDLLRKEIRLRLPLGVSVWPRQKGPSVSFGAIPYATVAHREPRLVNCSCEAEVTLVEFKQDWGVELQGGIRF
ncbi:MAG: hypothetical protein ACM3ZE_24695 [Myxococcales bacterium]